MNNIVIGDLLVPTVKNSSGYVFWKEAKYLIVHETGIEDIVLGNEQAHKMRTNKAFVESIVENGLVLKIEDDWQKAKILLTR